MKGEEERKEEVKVERRLLGIANKGATCYMNSLLQALFMTNDFRRMVYEWRYNEDLNPRKDFCIIY